jgi:hypothetical protein
VYLYSADLPELLSERTGDRLTLRWKAPGDRPFPLPVDVAIDGKVQKVAMPGGTATFTVPAAAHVVLDPDAHVLRRSESVEAVQRWARQR